MTTPLGWEALATMAVIAGVLWALVREWARPDLVLLASLGALLALGILTPEDAFAGFANKAVLAVAALFVVAAGVQSAGALAFADRLVFPRTASVAGATLRLMTTTAALSAFLNNTPLVAMLIPRVREWCASHGVPVSKLMMPLSFAAIVGGMTTLIGTSTNLLVAGLMEASGYPPLGLFDLAWVGVPAAVAVILYFALVGHRLLPDRGGPGLAAEEDLRHCLFEVRVGERSPLAGATVEEAGLRALGDAYLVHLHRGDHFIPSAPEAVLAPGDVLAFRGHASALDALLKRPGLERVHPADADAAQASLPLYEAVVAPTSRLVGRSLRDVAFREEYGGVVVGVQRRQAALDGALSRIPLEAGDLLLVEARRGFDRRWKAQRDEFYLVAPRRGEGPRVARGRAPVALLVLVAVVAVAAFGVADIVTTAFVGALAMIATGCLSPREAQRALDLPVLVVIAAALGLGQAIEQTGLAAQVAHLVVGLSPGLGAVGVVAAVFVATSLLTEIITNNAAAALMLGVALEVSRSLSVPPEALAAAVAIAASASFLTPIGYQTNLMVLSAGGYRFSDFVRTGAVVNLIVASISITMIWVVWL